MVREQVERDRKAELKRQQEANTPSSATRRHSAMPRPPSDTDLAGTNTSQKAPVVSEEAKNALKENTVEANGPPPAADRNALLQDLLSKRMGGNASRRKSAII